MEALFTQSFDSFEAAYAAAGEVFECRQGAKRPAGPNFNNAKVLCAKGRLYRSQSKDDAQPRKQRKQESQRIGCRFAVSIKRCAPLWPKDPLPKGIGPGRWFITPYGGRDSHLHNHEELPRTAFTRNRYAWVKARKDQIITMCDRGMRTRDIIGMLRIEAAEQPDAVVDPDTIYNIVKTHKHARRAEEQAKRSWDKGPLEELGEGWMDEADRLMSENDRSEAATESNVFNQQDSNNQ
ncbi:uncharacterized protein F5Z01DRAFT_103043 [Emericellopsis atlantica]|uniref:Uncharacterized protein n=1 Tax=Emericellopsis atlantica TaxID=2614577 RepID=A0A9P8CPQ4_9HYPO|nr:uncharacterized protein F5Z01DRAFT_103043 [Emericellopsis atlantica]KAG9254370.1 hypothetical protein F5Z01DRAFT_103043 [Emericellopsis atlantica]